ncbi:AQR1 (YNL065W) and QDR1 (YIL120W) [Zygosaccharomyces parabailii]|nr:AQR1 (YNL065W) and QDR1 (YIL120W) [Zygosaccharomyces parabailii]
MESQRHHISSAKPAGGETAGNEEVISLYSLDREQSVNATSGKQPAPYSRFKRRDKFALVIQCAATGFFSSIAAAIYYPVLTVIENKFRITEEQVNITVVVYFIFQGLSPTLMGNLADSLGRRPIILVSVIVYFAACVGIAGCHTYGQLIALRCLQAAGISPVIAINSGMMGDVTTRSERGGYVGYVAGCQVMGSAFGALIGAGVSSRWGWRSIFWFLSIGSGACIIFSLILLPETKRTIVGNGSITPKSIINKSPVLAIPAVRRELHLDDPDLETLAPAQKMNFLAPYKILLTPEIDMLLFVAGLQFATWTTHQTALSICLSKKYHLSVAKIGLCFLPAGIATLFSVVCSGRFLNWNYRRHMAHHTKWLKEQEEKLMTENNNDSEKVKNILQTDSQYSFNIFHARLQLAFVTLFLSSSGFAAFGWCIQVKAPLAAVLVTSAFASLFSNGILTMSVTLIVDLFPSKASTATGLLNLFRCLLSVVFIVSLHKMAAKMNYGGVFTFLAALTACSSSLLLIPVGKGKVLTHRRREDERRLLEDVEDTKN